MPTVEQFSGAKILCVGDVMLDRFVYGTIERISPEGPIPVLLTGKTQTSPGGAANVARNVATLGGACTLASVVGNDAGARRLGEDLNAIANIRTAFVVSPQRRTVEKKRFIAQGQQVLRVDSEDTTPISSDDAARMIATIAGEIKGHDVLVLSDYAKGTLTDSVLQQSIALAREAGIPVVVDPKSTSLHRYRGATVLTPNSREIAAATGLPPALSDADTVEAALLGMEQAASQAMLVTRAEKGMTLAQRGKDPVHIAGDVREVFDVAGAGDTVVAALALALAAGCDLEDAARIANIAAGIAVGRPGTSTVSQSDLLLEMARRNGNIAANVLNLAELKSRVETWKRDGLIVGFTNGCFDILHIGHIRLLEFSKSHCDRLIVATNSDVSVRRLKGAGRPINNQMDRAEVLAALGTVDAAIIFGEDTPQALIETLTPDVLVKGADYALDEIVGAGFVTARGGKVFRFALVPGKSSTDILQKVEASD